MSKEISRESIIIELVLMLIRQRKMQLRYEREKGLPRHMRKATKPICNVNMGTLQIRGRMMSEGYGCNQHRVTLYRALKRLQQDGFLELRGRLWYASPSLLEEIDELLTPE